MTPFDYENSESRQKYRTKIVREPLPAIRSQYICSSSGSQVSQHLEGYEDNLLQNLHFVTLIADLYSFVI